MGLNNVMSTESLQVRVTDRILGLADDIVGEGVIYIRNVFDYISNNINHRIYDETSIEHEASIRWRRSADQILEDGYVYKQKGCTDEVILFQSLCEAKGYKTRFVKVRGTKGNRIHSLAEVQIGDEWYLVDVGGKLGIREGKLKEDEEYGGWVYWKRGNDAWSLGFGGPSE